ncbi:hypothetical protein RISW2_23815, partial [Roseivivax isoporae LMG 25204]
DEADAAAADAAEAAAEAAGAAADTAADAAAVSAEGAAAPDPDVAAALSVEGYDAEEVARLVEQSDLSLSVKTSTMTALRNAEDNPELLATVLEQLRERLGLQQVE